MTNTSKPEIRYIGKNITYRDLKNFIIDQKLTDKNTIILNSDTFDSIVLEYRKFYNQSMTFPHLLLEVLIRESNQEQIPFERIGFLKNDTKSIRETPSIKDRFQYFDGEIFYRCNSCGNVIDYRGDELEGFERERAIYYIENIEAPIVKRTDGRCC